METGYSSVFIDTAPFIYFLENEDSNPHYYYAVRQFLSDCVAHKTRLVTSAVTVEEYMVHPYISGEIEYAQKFDKFVDVFNVVVVPIYDAVARRAAKIRAAYKGFKAMDALQLAAASECNCSAFLTNDKRLAQFASLKCVMVDSL